MVETIVGDISSTLRRTELGEAEAERVRYKSALEQAFLEAHSGGILPSQLFVTTIPQELQSDKVTNRLPFVL